MPLPGRHFTRNLIERRTLLFQLVRRDFEQRFIGSAAGWFWGLIHPLVLLASWVFVFQWCLHTRLPPNEVTQNYSLFLFCGFLPWLLFQETVQRSASSMLDHANLITKTVFPAEIVPVSIFLSSLINHLLSLGLVIAVVGFYSGHFSLWMFSLPVYMLLIGFFAVGIGWIVASLQVYLRDTAQVLSVVLTFWFWITPIFIDEQLFPVRVRWLLRLNPLAFLVRAYRERLLSYRYPDPRDFLLIAAYALAAFVLGGLFFRHLKRGFADVL
jgi:lipopolysaccharide transport system permease protein